MTTEISSVNSTTLTEQQTKQKTVQKSNLSESTQKELEALGIPVTDGMTEAEAQAKITKARQQQQTNRNSSEAEIMTDVKNLATRMGISVSDNGDISTILNEIGYEIEEMLDNVENNPASLATISGYLSELVNLDEQYENVTTLQENYNAAMNAIANNNKIALGL